MILRWRWLAGFAGTVALAILFRLAWDDLVFIFEEPLPANGTAVIFFIKERPEAIRLLSFRLGDQEHLDEDAAAEGRLVTGPSGRGSQTLVMVSALAGQQQARIRYRVATSPHDETFEFSLDLAVLTQCDIRVWFDRSGPRASQCVDHRPAAYGGAWRH